VVKREPCFVAKCHPGTQSIHSGCDYNVSVIKLKFWHDPFCISGLQPTTCSSNMSFTNCNSSTEKSGVFNENKKSP
jgi:hypothetical protein